MEDLRRKLRDGILPEALLTGGPKPVLTSGATTLTRDQLRAAAERVAGGLRAQDIRPGQRIAIYAANSL